MNFDRRILGIIAAVTMLGIMFGAPILAQVSEYAYSRVLFTVPSTMSFSLSLIGIAQNNSAPVRPGNQTEDIWFNATNQNTKYVEPCRVGGASCQARFATPVLRFTNVGTVPFNISIQLNETLPAGIVLFANFTNTSGLGCAVSVATNNTVIPKTSLLNFSKNLCPNNVTDVWLFANFTDQAGGTTIAFLNYTSNNV